MFPSIVVVATNTVGLSPRSAFTPAKTWSYSPPYVFTPSARHSGSVSRNHVLQPMPVSGSGRALLKPTWTTTTSAAAILSASGPGFETASTASGRPPLGTIWYSASDPSAEAT